MTDKEELKEIKKLADAMYYAAFNLTTDASLLREAMKEYHQFIIHEYCKEEPVAPKVLEDMLNAKTAAESLEISHEEHDRIVDELIYGKEPELVDVDDLPNKEEEPVSEEIGNYNHTAVLEGLGCQSKEDPVSEFLNTESMIESYKQRLISQANGLKNSPLIDMCLASYKHGINETLDILKLSNVERTVKNWKEHVSDNLEEAAFDYAESCKYDGGEKLLCVEHFKAGAQLQKEQFEKTLKDRIINAYNRGMKQMKKQMMVNAIDGDITFDYYGDDDKIYGCIAHDSFCLEDFGLKDRDKVKVIVIKED